jgi:hypothetical protein
LFLDIPFVPQLGYGHTRERGIDRLLRQSHELAGIVLVVLGQSDEQLGLDRLWLHWFSLCIQFASRRYFEEWPIRASAGNLSRVY